MFRLDGVDAAYGDNTVLRGVTLQVPRGKVVALLGANGAGKSTLLRVASGLLVPTAGDIVLGERSLLGESPDEFAQAGICHVPEGRGIFRSMTVRENLLLQARPGCEDEAILRAAEAFPRLKERLDQRAGTLSGGEQQMLAVCRALVANAAFVFVDEVSLGLAPLIVDEIFDSLGRLVDSGVALLVVEQYVARALRIADFVFILDQGAVVFAGEPCELDEAEVFRAYVGADVA